MSSLSSVVAARPVVEFFSTSQAAERAPTDARLPEDRVSLSPEARRQLRGGPADAAGQATAGQAAEGPGKAAGKATARPGAPRKLDAAQEREVADLKQRDLHVRQHEAAHQAAGGDLTGAATFSYQTGPDGRSYAVGGEVPIAARSSRTPDETIAIARRVRAAALAPADPSSADLAAAASATRLEQAAQAQKQAARASQAQARGPDGSP